jgi:hypothetical protein
LPITNGEQDRNGSWHIKGNQMKFIGPPQSGSQADTVASHNRAGQYYRNRRTPVNTVGTGRRAIQRSNFGTASKAWSTLSPSQQNAWASYAAGYPIVDALGQSITLTGHQMFVSVNSQLLNVGSPVTFSVPVSNATGGFVVPGFTVVGAGAVTVTPNGNADPADFILIAFSRPVSGGVSFMKTFWQQTVVAGDFSTSYVATAAYTAQFGPAASGQRVFCKLTPVNQYGVTGVPVILMAIVS